MNTNIINWRNLCNMLHEKGVDITTNETDKISKISLHGSSGEGTIYSIDVPKTGTIHHTLSNTNEYETFKFELNIHNGELEKLHLILDEEEVFFENGESNITLKIKKDRKDYTVITEKE